MKNVLNKDQEQMRANVVELELKARYWKAQHDIRFYTLEAEKLQKAYDEYLEVQRLQHEEMLKNFQEQMANIDNMAEKGEVEVK